MERDVVAIDPLTWPAVGRVGTCMSGEAKGSLIFLHLAIDDRDPRRAYWQAFLKPPLATGEDELFVDHASGAMQRFLDSVDVEWEPEGTDGPFEDSQLGLRRSFASNGSRTYSAFIEKLDENRGGP